MVEFIFSILGFIILMAFLSIVVLTFSKFTDQE